MTEEVNGLGCHSKKMADGFLFAAIDGTDTDGYDYIEEAVDSGARWVLCNREPSAAVSWILVEDVREAFAKMAANWYGRPAEQLQIIGITGTNGKTTTSYLLKHILETVYSQPVGLIGTNQNMIGATVFPAERTTPDSGTLHSLFAQMLRAGCRCVVMEVSSHALAQKRTAGIEFALAVFTNLTQDHLDYHATMAEYCAAKAQLFRQCRAAVVNGDDPWTEQLLHDSTCPAIRYGQNLDNDIVGWQPVYSSDSVRFTLCDDRQQIPARIGIPGAFSLYNALAALTAAGALGIDMVAAAAALEDCGGVRGRAEVVAVTAPYTVLIDYAHTPDGLQHILKAVGAFTHGRVIVVFGCGGDRDRSKRAMMGQIAALSADLVVLSSDNPRSENPYAILHDILQGMREHATPFAVIEDRREAIFHALRCAKAGDVVLLAGKGHEQTQTVGGELRRLDEREIVKEYFSQNQTKESR